MRFPARRTFPLLALPLLLLAACSPADPVALTNEGYQALGRGDWEGALGSFEEALAAMEETPAPKQLDRARLGALKARAQLAPSEALVACLEQVDAGEADAEVVAQVGAYLLDAGARTQAIDLMDQGMQRFEGSAELAALQTRILAEAEGDEDALEQLRGLGYLGG